LAEIDGLFFKNMKLVDCLLKNIKKKCHGKWS